MAFPDSDSTEAVRAVRQCFEFFGSYLSDLLTYFRKHPSRRVDEYEWEGWEYVEAAYATGKGAIFFGGHWGVWELQGIAHGLKGGILGEVVRKLENPYLEKLLFRLRSCTGNFVIEKTEGFRPMLKALREGKGIALLIDQNVVTEDRIFVDFFGISASTTPSLGLLKLKTDCALIPAFGLPLPKNRYRFIYGPPVEVSLTGNRQEDVFRITQECTRVIEEQIRRYPGYWLWMHRRWKTRPEGTRAAVV